MSTLAQFAGGYGPVSSLVNYFSAGGVSYTGANLSSQGAVSGLKEFLSGALTANTLATPTGLSISGRGRINALTAYTKDATARTLRCKIIIDGTTVFDATTNSMSAAGAGVIPIGSVDGAGAIQQYGSVIFYSSLVVQIASNLTETDKVAVGINYETWA